MVAMTKIGVWSNIKAVVVFRICLFLQLADLSITVCREECYSDTPRMHVSMQLGKSIPLCLDYIDYRLTDLALLDNNCNGLDNYVHPSVNATYICTAVNVTQNTMFEAQPCELLVVVECVRKAPVALNGCDKEFRDDDERECGGGDGGDSDSISYDDYEGGVESNMDDNAEDDLVIGLMLESTNQQLKSSCNVFINVSMIDPGMCIWHAYT